MKDPMEVVLFCDVQRLMRELEAVYSTAIALDLPEPVSLKDRTDIKNKLYRIHDALGQRWEAAKIKDKAA